MFKVYFSRIFCENMSSFSPAFLYGWEEREQEGNAEKQQESRALYLTMPLGEHRTTAWHFHLDQISCSCFCLVCTDCNLSVSSESVYTTLRDG